MHIDYGWRGKILWAVCLSMCLTACGVSAQTSDRISQQALVNQIETGTAPVILDVRTATEYEAGHIPGAINIHFREIENRLDEIPDGPIVVYCERGIRAVIAEKTLRQAGISSIFHLDGDISAWRENNLPLERPTSMPEEAPSVPSPPQANSLEKRWVVSGAEAKQLIEQGATVLDTRKLALTRLPRAVYVDWRQFSPQEATTRGRLLDDDGVLTQKLQALGISNQRPVVVLANPPSGWGEDGRIVWMLRTLGHTQAVMVDGGVDALAGESLPTRTAKAATPGDFVVNRDPTWEISRDRLKAQLDNVAVIDTREEREFAGKTPYGEQRGGHIPEAIHLYFKTFLADDGTLLPTQEIRAMLQETGITQDTQIVVYCTGGIRSGWVAAVLVTLGYDVKNYAGSMWEWSAAPAESFPLETL